MFKVGDRVRVVKSYQTSEYWVSQMDKYVGNGVEYGVTKVEAFDDGWVKLDLGIETWMFPTESLELVNKQSNILIDDIEVSGYNWNGKFYADKIALLRGIIKQRFDDFIATDCDEKFIEQFIEQLKEVKEVCQKLK